MTGETIDCFNCGRPNPEWAQVCRSCGVPLRHGAASAAPTGPFPTDRESLVSIGAVIGTILAAVIVGFIISNLNPTTPTVGQLSPSPDATPLETSEPTMVPTPVVTPSPTPVPTPALRGTLVFGTELDGNRQIPSPTDSFTPAMNFAYSVTVPDGLGQPAIRNQISKVADGEETVVLDDQVSGLDPAATTFGFLIGTAREFLGPWGPGEFVWRVYIGEELVAEGRFRYAEG